MSKKSIYKRYYSMEDVRRSHKKYITIGFEDRTAIAWSRGLPEIFKVAYICKYNDTFYKNYAKNKSALYAVSPHTQETFKSKSDEEIEMIINYLSLNMLEHMFGLKRRFKLQGGFDV